MKKIVSFLSSVSFPSVVLLLLQTAVVNCVGLSPREGARKPAVDESKDVLTFHYDSERHGSKTNETQLTPEIVSSGRFGLVWESHFPNQKPGPLDAILADDKNHKLAMDPATGKPFLFSPHLYATPLYVHDLQLEDERHFNTVIAASSNGVVYAINAGGAGSDASADPGTILWQTKPDQKPSQPHPQKGQLGTPVMIPDLDGGLNPRVTMPLGILGTPVIDRSSTPPRLFVTAVDNDKGWQVHALDLTSGRTLWTLPINDSDIKPTLEAGHATFQGQFAMSQRGALLLSQDAKKLFIPFGAYNDGGVGFMVMVDTTTRELQAFASDLGNPTVNGQPFASGGMWAAGGPAMDSDGKLYATTGNSGGVIGNQPDFGPVPGTWGQSLLQWNPKPRQLELTGTYTPFNYCQMDVGDIDLAGSSPVVIDLDPATTSTPHLLAFGSKQGNLYLVDRDHLTHSDRRPNCMPENFDVAKFERGPESDEMHHPDPLRSHETSLFDPSAQLKQYGGRPGPLNVFGPYQEEFNNGNLAKMRTTPAVYRDASGRVFIYVSGTTRKRAVSKNDNPPPRPELTPPDSIDPGLVKLEVVAQPGKPAFLKVVGVDRKVPMITPGSPVVTSQRGQRPIVWVMDAGILRIGNLLSPQAPRAILYAFDGDSMNLLWSSEMRPEDHLHVGGKYSSPTVADGLVFVGTDRIQAFGAK